MRADMAGMKNMEAMLKSMLEAQKLRLMSERSQKVKNMEKQQLQWERWRV